MVMLRTLLRARRADHACAAFGNHVVKWQELLPIDRNQRFGGVLSVSLRRSLELASALLLGLTLAGCGTQVAAQKASKPPAHKHKTSAPASSPSSSSSSGSTNASGSGSSSGSGSGSGSGSTVTTVSPSGVSLSYSIAPPAQTSGGAMALLSVANVPSGWTLESLQAWSSAGEMASETPSQAMTSVFGQPQGGFSMGSDGQVISYFFPNPPGAWANTTVHFTLIFQTSAGTTQSVSSGDFGFPAE
jgi:hypothetical protein